MNYFLTLSPRRTRDYKMNCLNWRKIYYILYTLLFIRTHSDTKLLNKLLGNEAQKKEKRKSLISNSRSEKLSQPENSQIVRTVLESNSPSRLLWKD